MKKITVKNYFILAFILIITVVLVFYIRSWYNTSKIYYSQNSIIKDVASEINEDEIFNYTMESQKFILYVSSGSNVEIKNFEKSLKKIIKKLDISSDILYLNLDNVNIDIFNSSLQDKFALNSNIASHISNSSFSTIYIFEDGKIVTVLNNLNNFSDKQVESFLKKWGFKND